VDAPISISESGPNPASTTDRAEIAAMARTKIPTTFKVNVAYSSAKPRLSKAFRPGSSATVTAESPALHSTATATYRAAPAMGAESGHPELVNVERSRGYPDLRHCAGRYTWFDGFGPVPEACT